MSSQQLRIQMAGGGPYGFRLLGGDANPLTVSKIRPSSKAQVSGLLEGDVILAVNDISCQGLSHPTATGLIESNNNGLTVLILRGKDARREAPSAISTLGSNVRRLNDEEATILAQRHGNQVQTASDSYNGYSSDGPGGGGPAAFRLSAPPSGDSLKQTRILRRESRSEDLPPATLPPRIVLVNDATPAGPPSFYTREEKTSTDGGGRTTRTVEEVKTEKFGGTTLTKVTKQEFTSYSSGGGGPSMVRSREDRGNPPAKGDGGQVWDDRGWTAASNVERRSVPVQPLEGARIVRITQEPAVNSGNSWVVYEEDGIGGREQVSSGQLGNRQVIPAIEIHFEPDEAGFVKTSAVQPATDPNIKIRVGDEVSFQPNVQIQPAPWDHQEFQQHPPPNLKTYQAPRIEVERKIVSSTHTQSYPSEQQQRQPSRIEVHCYGSSNQPGGTSSDRQFQEIGNRGFNYEQNNYSEDARPSRVLHAQPQPTVKPEFPAKTDNYQLYDQRERYNDAIHSQNDYKQQQNPRPQTGNNPQEGYYPEDGRGYTAVVHNPNQAPRNKPGRTETHDAVNKFNARPADQYASEAVEEPPYGYPQTGYRPQSQLHEEPGPPNRPFGREAGEQHAPFSSAPAAQQYGYGTYPGARNPAKGKQAEATTYDNEPILPQRLPGTRDMQTKKVTWNQPESQYRAYVEPDRFVIPAEVGRPESAGTVRDRPVFPGPAGRPPVRQDNRVERVEIGAAQKWTPGSKLLPMKQPPVDARQIKGGTAVGSYGSRGNYEDVYRPPAEEGWYEASAGTAPADARSLPDEVPPRGYEAPSRGYEVPTRGYEVPSRGYEVPSRGYEVPPRGYEAPSRGYEAPARGYEAPARGYDQKRPGNEYPPAAGPTHVRYSWAGYPGEQQATDWPEWQGGGHRHHHPGAQNTWKQPSFDDIRGQDPRDYVDDWEDPNDAVPMYGPGGDWGGCQPEPSRAPPAPPPAPPFGPGMMAGRPPHPPAMFPQPQEPRAPPPPAAPPIDQLKVYRGHGSSDGGGGYGLTSLEERVKVANSMALSVLAPENRNSRGQKMFIRRRENSHKWTKEGPDPVPEKKAPQQQQQQPWAAQGQNDQNAWTTQPRFPEQARPAAISPSQYPGPSSGHLSSSAYQQQEESSAYSLADDVASGGGKGGELFAKRKAKSEKWTSYESPGSQPRSVEGPAAGGRKFGVSPSHAAVDQRQAVGVKWQQQQPAFGSSSYNQGPQTPKLGPGLPQAPQSYKTVRFQGAPPPAFSSSPAPSYGQLPGPRQPPKFGPKQFGGKVTVSRSVGFTDL